MTRDLQTGMIICSSILFFTVIVAGMFASSAASVWIRNRREERASAERIQTARADESRDRERNEWVSLLRQKDEQINSLNNEVLRLSRNYDVARKLLQVAAKKGEADE